MTPMLRKAFKFFLENADYCTPPGRTACALELARAESKAFWNELDFAVHPDEDPDTSWMDRKDLERYQSGEIEIVGVILLDNNGWGISSLWGITAPTDDYLRVIKAQLAAEYFSTIASTLHIVQHSF